MLSVYSLEQTQKHHSYTASLCNFSLNLKVYMKNLYDLPSLILQYLLPQQGISRLVGKIACCRIVWLKNWLIKKFITYYQVNMEEAVTETPENYPDFNSFFTRALKPHARIIDIKEHGDTHTIISPVDGKISQIGKIENNMLLQAKGKSYTLEQLLVLPELAEIFRNGNFATLYLSPRDYHRIHMPLTGKLRQMIYVPGTLFAVNANATRNVPYLFGRNERVITIFDTDREAMALILVGALIVGSIATTWAGTVTSNTYIRRNNKQPQIWSYKDQSIVLQLGEEMGRFQLGSTVILLFPQHAVQWFDTLDLHTTIKMGQAIGCDTKYA